MDNLWIKLQQKIRNVGENVVYLIYQNGDKHGSNNDTGNRTRSTKLYEMGTNMDIHRKRSNRPNTIVT